jgi:hypothetical protein
MAGVAVERVEAEGEAAVAGGALDAAGTGRGRPGRRGGASRGRPLAQLTREDLLLAFGDAVRQAGAVPSLRQFVGSVCSHGVLRRLAGGYRRLQALFAEYAAERPEWIDVAALAEPAAGRPARCGAADLPPPLPSCRLRYAPENESGVVLLFGLLARELGFAVERVQAGFPDCTALREAGPGRWRRVRIEFEFESRNFALHGHPPDGCDLIVCWRHNWPACPRGLEVLALEGVAFG